MQATGVLRVGILALGILAVGAVGRPSVPNAEPLEDAPGEASCVPRSECCKVCTTGQACGNTCISRSKNCHKGRGCACNADEICG
jgi:hypothetical protein